ncbi:hypothetical protein [Janibacter melonis]|uniref:hypothetical protein n=1 Tax=Janibacter melonis TaxID=262209 RepID=UPI0020964D86|nr:hypothetical protein [Janibacter melonis]
MSPTPIVLRAPASCSRRSSPWPCSRAAPAGGSCATTALPPTSRPGSGAPAGADFYRADAQEIRDGEHGSLIWSREEAGTGLEGPAPTSSSTARWGRRGARRGLRDRHPAARRAAGGRLAGHLVGHGTTGTADTCAPSLTTLQGQARFYTSLTQRVLDTYLQRGYVVVASDYEGWARPALTPTCSARARVGR